MESNVVEVQFLYAPRVSQYSVIVCTEDEQTQMGLAELKDKYPMLCVKLGEMFDPRPDNLNWDMAGGDWECGEGTLHPHTQHTCDCAEMNEEICRGQIEYEDSLGNAIDKQIEESQDGKKLQSYPGYLANLK